MNGISEYYLMKVFFFQNLIKKPIEEKKNPYLFLMLYEISHKHQNLVPNLPNLIIMKFF